MIQKRLEMGEFGWFRQVKSFWGLFRGFVMEKKRILWKHTVKVDGDPEEHQKHRRLMMMMEGFP